MPRPGPPSSPPWSTSSPKARMRWSATPASGASLAHPRAMALPSIRPRSRRTPLFDGLLTTLARAHAEGRLEDRLAFYGKPKLLIVDELGYPPFEANAAHLFFQLVSRRYERGRLLITSNRSVGEWGTVFGDPVVATAILDRLLHHSHDVTIRGDSNRLREKRHPGLIKAPPLEQDPAKEG